MKKLLVEFGGTPASGKSSIIKELCRMIKYGRCEIIEADHFKTPMARGANNFELKALWSIFDTYSEAIRVFKGDRSARANLTIFNRGLFDRIAWARLLQLENQYYANVAKDIEKWLQEFEFLCQIDLVVLVLTSYEKVETRKRPGRPFRIINPKTIDNLNQIYLDLYSELGNDLNIVMLDDLNDDLSLAQKVSIVSSNIDELL